LFFLHKGDSGPVLFYLGASKEHFPRLEKRDEFVQVSFNLAEVYNRNSKFCFRQVLSPNGRPLKTIKPRQSWDQAPESYQKSGQSDGLNSSTNLL
jgi:hypothetical protein